MPCTSWNHSSESTLLIVDVTLYNQILQHNRSLTYKIENVLTNIKYEVRVSYPAVIPTDFVIEVFPFGDYVSRKLLNVEQLQFVAVSRNYLIKVTAYRTGFPQNLKRLDDPVLFNIIVNRLYLSCSLETWKLLISSMVLVILILRYGVPIAIRIIEKTSDKRNQ